MYICGEIGPRSVYLNVLLVLDNSRVLFCKLCKQNSEQDNNEQDSTREHYVTNYQIRHGSRRKTKKRLFPNYGRILDSVFFFLSYSRIIWPFLITRRE